MRKKCLEHSHGEETRETEKTMQERKKGGTSKQITHTLGSEIRRKTPLLNRNGRNERGKRAAAILFPRSPDFCDLGRRDPAHDGHESLPA
ncbi:unnamed protein product [Sphagnum troendelagicum]